MSTYFSLYRDYLKIKKTESLLYDESITKYTPTDFSIIKVLTNSGERIAMCYTSDVSKYSPPILSNLDFEEAKKKVIEISSREAILTYDKTSDIIIGNVPSFMIDKCCDNSTSYRNIKENKTINLKYHEIQNMRNTILKKIDIINNNINDVQTALSKNDIDKTVINTHLETIKENIKTIIK